MIVNHDRSIVSMGYNGFPRGVDDSGELLADRPQKLARVVHAEMNALLTALRNGADVSGCTLYTWPFATCSNCAGSIIQANIHKVVFPEPTEDQLERWGDSFKIAMDMYRQAGVLIEEVGDMDV